MSAAFVPPRHRTDFVVGPTAPGAIVPPTYRVQFEEANLPFAHSGGYPLIVLQGDKRLKPFTLEEAKFSNPKDRDILSHCEYTINLPINVNRVDMMQTLDTFYPKLKNPAEYRLINGERISSVGHDWILPHLPIFNTPAEMYNYTTRLREVTGSNHGFKWIVCDASFPPPKPRVKGVDISLSRLPVFHGGIADTIMLYLRRPAASAAPSPLPRPDLAAKRREEEKLYRAGIAASNSVSGTYKRGAGELQTLASRWGDDLDGNGKKQRKDEGGGGSGAGGGRRSRSGSRKKRTKVRAGIRPKRSGSRRGHSCAR